MITNHAKSHYYSKKKCTVELYIVSIRLAKVGAVKVQRKWSTHISG